MGMAGMDRLDMPRFGPSRRGIAWPGLAGQAWHAGKWLTEEWLELDWRGGARQAWLRELERAGQGRDWRVAQRHGPHRHGSNGKGWAGVDGLDEFRQGEAWTGRERQDMAGVANKGPEGRGVLRAGQVRHWMGMAGEQWRG